MLIELGHKEYPPSPCTPWYAKKAFKGLVLEANPQIVLKQQNNSMYYQLTICDHNRHTILPLRDKLSNRAKEFFDAGSYHKFYVECEYVKLLDGANNNTFKNLLQEDYE